MSTGIPFGLGALRTLRRDPYADLLASLDVRTDGTRLAAPTHGLDPDYAVSQAIARDPRVLTDPRRHGAREVAHAAFPSASPPATTSTAPFQPMAADALVRAAAAPEPDQTPVDMLSGPPVPSGVGPKGGTAPAYDYENETPVGLAPGRMPVDPTRDGSVQPTDAGKSLQAGIGRIAAGLGGRVADVAMVGPNLTRAFLDGTMDSSSEQAAGLGLQAAGFGMTGGFGVGARAALPAGERAIAEAAPIAAREAAPASQALARAEPAAVSATRVAPIEPTIPTLPEGFGGPYGRATPASTDDGMAAIRAGIMRHLEDPTLGRAAASPAPTSSPLTFGPYGKGSGMSVEDGMDAIANALRPATEWSAPLASAVLNRQRALGLGAAGLAAIPGAAMAADGALPQGSGSPDEPAAIPPGHTGYTPPSAPTMQPDRLPSPVQPVAPSPAGSTGAAVPRMFGALAPQMPSSADAAVPVASLVGAPPPAMPRPAATRAPEPLADDEADKPAPNAMPAQGRAPLSIAPPTAPAPPAATATAQPSDGFDFGGALDRFKKNGGFDTLGNIGIGLMSTRGFGPGLAAGLKLDQDSGVKRAATDLARAEFGLKAQKAAQEQRALTGNAQYVMGKIPGISADQAVTLGSNSAFMNDLFKGILPPTELYKQYADKDGNIWNQNARTGQATVALKADEDKTQRPLTDPAERAKYGIAADDTKPYQVDANNKVSAIGGGGTSVSVDLGKKAAGEADAQILKKIDTSYDKAQGALGTLAAIGRQKQAIDRGIISGWGADWQTQARAMAGKLLGLSDEDVSNSQAFEGAAASKSAELAKAISQAGHTTNMDLQLGKTIAGGDRSKTEAAIRQIIDAQELLAKDTIAHHNAGVDRYVGASPDMKDRMGWYHVETPDVYRYGQGTPNPVADPGSAPPPMTRTIGGKTYSRGPDGHWYEGK